MTADLAQKGRVLVVDDDASLAEMLTIVLRQEGFESRVCGRGDEAMDAFRDFRPDLVLLDLMLPGKDGIDVCKEIREESGVPIVMLTAKSDTVDVVVGLESGADDYVVKPFKPKELVARIRARVRRLDAPTARGPDDRRPQHRRRRSLRDPRRHAGQPHAPGVRPPATAWPASPGRCSPARCCSSRSGATGTPRTPGWSTCTSSGCAPRSSTTPRTREIIVTVRGVGYKAGDVLGRPMARTHPVRRRTPRSHLLASLHPGPGRRQHRAALGRRHRRPSAGCSSGRPRTACSSTGVDAVRRRGRQRDGRRQRTALAGARRRHRRERPARRPRSTRSRTRGAARGFEVVLAGPAGSGDAAGTPAAAGHAGARAQQRARPRWRTTSPPQPTRPGPTAGSR